MTGLKHFCIVYVASTQRAEFGFVFLFLNEVISSGNFVLKIGWKKYINTSLVSLNLGSVIQHSSEKAEKKTCSIVFSRGTVKPS